ncbi:protein kinase family protein [Saccharothrix sp. ST-888]|uniref:protein kinase family protein n=1 Tax=Saccharothrix sp. ST-888 TaxID=1427391 RepID=UPI00069751E5|nr:protein kinase family protein [Saccharothrix sp. ST-888]
MADGTKAVVDASVADEAALAMAIGDIPSDTPDDQPGDDRDGTPTDAPVTAPTHGAAKDARKSDTGRSGADRPTENGRAAKSGSPSAKAEKAEKPAAARAATPETAESTAPLSSAEIAAELAAGAAALAAAAQETAKEVTEAAAAAAEEPARVTPKGAAKDAGTASSTAAAKAEPALPPAGTGTGQLPAVLPAPLRHSGDKIADRYRLEECIGQSETFSSWRAVDEKLRRAVGVHLLAAGHQRAKAVLAAAKSAALLGDPRFVQVLDAVQEGELVYVIREWLPDATDLAKLLAAGPMEPYDAYQMVRQVTDAISAAHRRGQAHLRLTPRCVLRTESGQYRINGIAVDAALRGLPDEDAERTDTRAIGVLLYAALTHRWPFPEDRYDLQGLPKSLGCVPPDQVKAGVHKGLSELAARALCEQLPHSLEPITSPDELAKAIALMPKIRQPEPPAPPAFTPPRYNPPRPAQPLGGQNRAAQQRSGHPHGPQPHGARPMGPDTGHIPARPAGPRRRMRTLAKWTASLVALAAIGVASWQLVSSLNNQDKHKDVPVTADPTPGGTQANSAPPETVVGKPVDIAGASSFNALNGEAEHPSDVQYAIDGNLATSWSTQGYYADLGGAFKAGTGLMINLGSAKRVTSVHVQFVGGTKVELKAAPQNTSAPPPINKDGLAAFGQSVASGSGTEVDLKPQAPLTTRYLLIWLTSIPKDDSDGQYRGRIAEVSVNG